MAINWPKVQTEEETLLAAAHGRSIARFGDGELRIAVGGNAISQRGSAALQNDLRHILRGDYAKHALTCIPNLNSVRPSPAMPFYSKYGEAQFSKLLGEQDYGSTWCTRADCAPWIDNDDYWTQFESIWRDKVVALVAGAPDMFEMIGPFARGIRRINAPKTDAYGEIGRIMEEVGKPSGPVIISLGAAGTVLAAKLAARGLWALDVGHVFMFMRHGNRGAYAFTFDDFCSPYYRKQLLQMHGKHVADGKGRWGRSGHRHWSEVKNFANKLGAKWILDYGAGAETFAREAVKEGFRVEQFDAGTDKIVLPKQVDISTSADVLEHVEPEKIDNVLRFLYLIARKGGWHKIALKEANKKLPDGRNAHILLRSPEWWRDAFARAGWSRVTIMPHPSPHKHCILECIK